MCPPFKPSALNSIPKTHERRQESSPKNYPLAPTAWHMYAHSKYTMIIILKINKYMCEGEKACRLKYAPAQARTVLGSAIVGMGILSLYQSLVLETPLLEAHCPSPRPCSQRPYSVQQPRQGPCTPPSLVWLSGSDALPRIWCQPLGGELGNCDRGGCHL